MENKRTKNTGKNDINRLLLKKKSEKNAKIHNGSSDVIILDDSVDILRPDFPKNVQSTPKIYSPIVINDSHDSNDGLFDVRINDKKPSKDGNVSFNCSIMQTTLEREDIQPTSQGWSPAQNIVCATPRYTPAPSTPKDITNESLEECSLKKIHQSHKKLLNELYGDVWKTLPSQFKTISHNHIKCNGVSKKLQFDNDDSDKENIKQNLQENKQLYLTASDTKLKFAFSDTARKSKKKLFTEKVQSTPEPSKLLKRKVNTTSNKLKGKSVTELVEIMRKDVDILTKNVRNITIDRVDDYVVKRLSFIGSLADNIPSWRCHPEAFQYRDNYKTLKEQLTRRLFQEFNKYIFDNALDADMSVVFDTKLRSTAGTTTNRLIKTSRGDRVRVSSIKLSTKVVDAPQRLRDTLVHEMCHAATWLVDGDLKAAHGPLWKKWATRALQVFPELHEISRCHNLEIHFKYSYRCTRCSYKIQRHSKSIDITKKCCGYCHGKFELVVNRKNKDGVVVSTPARKGKANDFAKYVKENYGTHKDGTRTHAQVMKILGEQFSAVKKNKIDENDD